MKERSLLLCFLFLKFLPSWSMSNLNVVNKNQIVVFFQFVFIRIVFEVEAGHYVWQQEVSETDNAKETSLWEEVKVNKTCRKTCVKVIDLFWFTEFLLAVLKI